jgi:hypothetical protein
MHLEIFGVTFAWHLHRIHVRIRESDANVDCTCRARSAPIRDVTSGPFYTVTAQVATLDFKLDQCLLNCVLCRSNVACILGNVSGSPDRIDGCSVTSVRSFLNGGSPQQFNIWSTSITHKVCGSRRHSGSIWLVCGALGRRWVGIVPGHREKAAAAAVKSFLGHLV